MSAVVVVRFVIPLIVVVAQIGAAWLGATCATNSDCASVKHSECSGGKCSCGIGYYVANIKNCYPSRKPGYSCNVLLTTQNQCVDRAVCKSPSSVHQFRYSNIGGNYGYYYGYNGVCMCELGYHSTGRACEPRIALGGSCIFYGTFGKDIGDGQCQDHAACRTHFLVSGSLTYRCECVEEYYVPKDGVCVKEIPLGGICTHNGENECVTPNADCYAKEGKSTCQCSDEYRQDGHSACVSGNTAVELSQTGTGYNPCLQGIATAPDCGGPYAYPGHPNMFIQCDTTCTITYEMTCSPTLVWNDSIKGCGYP